MRNRITRPSEKSLRGYCSPGPEKRHLPRLTGYTACRRCLPGGPSGPRRGPRRGERPPGPGPEAPRAAPSTPGRRRGGRRAPRTRGLAPAEGIRPRRARGRGPRDERSDTRRKQKRCHFRADRSICTACGGQRTERVGSAEAIDRVARPGCRGPGQHQPRLRIARREAGPRSDLAQDDDQVEKDQTKKAAMG